MLIDEVWIIEAIKNGIVTYKETYTTEAEAKSSFSLLCDNERFTNDLDSIELYHQLSNTGEILERKVRTFR